MADPFSTVTPPDLPPLTQTDGSELVAVWRNGRLAKMPQRDLRGTKTFSGASGPPYEASRLFTMQASLNDRWRNTTTRDEYKLTVLDPITWVFDGNVGGGKGEPGAPGAGISPKGQFATTADLPTMGLPGDLYVATADDTAQPPAFLAGDGAMYVATGGTFGPGNHYRNIGPFRGPPGATTVDGLEDATPGFKALNVDDPSAPGNPIGDGLAARVVAQGGDASATKARRPGGVSRALSDILDNSIDVRDFGAKDDDLTNNTAAFTSAINAATTSRRTLNVTPSTGGTGIYRLSPSVDWKNVNMRLDNGVAFKGPAGEPYTGRFAGSPFFDQAVKGGLGVLGEQGRKVELPGATYSYSNVLGTFATPTVAAFRLHDGQPTPPATNPLLAFGPAFYGYVGLGQTGNYASGSGGIYGGQMNVFRANNGPGVTISCTLNNGSIYATNCTSTAGIFDPSLITSTTAGIPPNTYLDPTGDHAGVTGTIALASNYTGATTNNAFLSVNGTQFIGSLFNGTPFISYVNDVSKATNGSVITRVSDGATIGTVVAAAMDTIKMSAPYTGASTGFQGATLTAVSGRGEITPLAYGVNLARDVPMPGLSIYTDLSHSTNTSGNAADQEGYLAGVMNLVTKWVPGWLLDRLHQGSFGLQTITRPGPGGHDFVDRTGATSYPLLAGHHIGGWSGPVGSATDGTSASATPGYWVGNQVGSLGYDGTSLVTTGGGVWCFTGVRSKLGYGQIISDYTLEGLRIDRPIGMPGAAIHVCSGAGDSFFDTNVIVKGFIFEITPVTPSGPNATGVAGQRAWDANYEYRCVAPNRWRRIPFSSDWP